MNPKLTNKHRGTIQVARILEVRVDIIIVQLSQGLLMSFPLEIFPALLAEKCCRKGTRKM